MTMKEMCEKIATELERRHGLKLDPKKDIFEMDPRGELYPVFALYQALFPEESQTTYQEP